jgi:hypothetical protein
MRFALVAVLMALTVPVVAQTVDPFVAERNEAAARNPASPRFTIALPDGRRAFRIGELIPLIFRYVQVGNRRMLENLPYAYFAEAVLDRTVGTANPRKDFERARLYVSGGLIAAA